MQALCSLCSKWPHHQWGVVCQFGTESYRDQMTRKTDDFNDSWARWWIWNSWSSFLFSRFASPLCQLLPTGKKRTPPPPRHTWLGTSITMSMLCLLPMSFITDEMNTSSPTGSKYCSTRGRCVWTARDTVLKSKSYLVTFHKYFWSPSELFSQPLYKINTQ